MEVCMREGSTAWVNHLLVLPFDEVLLLPRPVPPLLSGLLVLLPVGLWLVWIDTRLCPVSGRDSRSLPRDLPLLAPSTCIFHTLLLLHPTPQELERNR